MIPIPIVITEVPSQKDKVQKMVDYCRKLDGTELMVLKVPPAIAAVPHKGGVGGNLTFGWALRELYNTPFFWLETDSIPLYPGTFYKIYKEWLASGKLFSLPDLSSVSRHDVASGVGIYPAKTGDMIPIYDKLTRLPFMGWDDWIYRNLTKDIHFTRLIQHDFAVYSENRLERRHAFPRDLLILDAQALMFHSDPTQSLMTQNLARIPDKQPSLVVLGLAHQCAGTVVPMLESIERVCSPFFKTINYCILGSQAPERHLLGTSAIPPYMLGTSARPPMGNTLSRLFDWQKKDPLHRVVSAQRRDFKVTHQIERYQKMAVLRNTLLKMSAHFPVPTYYLMADLDVKEMIDEGGMRKLLTNDQWDAVSVYGVANWNKVSKYQRISDTFMWRGASYVYYDLLAFESLDKRRILWQWVGHPPGETFPHGSEVDALFTWENLAPKIGEWTEVNSSFGPATFYKAHVFSQFSYDSNTLQVEHCSLHQQMRKAGMRICVAGDVVGVYL